MKVLSVSQAWVRVLSISHAWVRVLSIESEGIDSFTSKQELGYCQLHKLALVKVLSVKGE